MAVYYIASYDITDPETFYGKYAPNVGPLLQRHGGEVLVISADSRPIEGSPCSVSVVLKFDTEAAALDWYNDPDYAPLKNLRHQSTTNSTAVLAKQSAGPSQ